MDLRARLREEFRRRADRNPRYSLRAFARAVGLHHSNLARVLDGSRGLSRRSLRRVCGRLGLAPSDLQGALIAEDARKVLLAASLPDFRPDARWIAMKSGVELDDVN